MTNLVSSEIFFFIIDISTSLAPIRQIPYKKQGRKFLSFLAREFRPCHGTPVIGFSPCLCQSLHEENLSGTARRMVGLLISVFSGCIVDTGGTGRHAGSRKCTSLPPALVGWQSGPAVNYDNQFLPLVCLYNENFHRKNQGLKPLNFEKKIY